MRPPLVTLMFLLGSFAAGAAESANTSAPPLLRISIQAPKDTYILGEPIVFLHTWENLGTSPLQIAFAVRLYTPASQVHIAGPIDQRCAMREQVNYAFRAQPLEDTVSMPFDLRSQAGAVNEGEYEFWVVYDATLLSQTFEDAGVLGMRVESNHVRFRIVQPTGVDAAAFEKCRSAGKCNRVFVNEERLKEFPTSTYAAYQLWGQAHAAYVAPEDAAEAEYFVHQKARDAGTTNYYESVMEKESRAIEVLERLHRDFPNFIYQTDVLYTLLRTYFKVGDPEKAVPILKELFDEHPSSDAVRKAQAYKQVLQANDIWPDKGPIISGPTPKN